MKNTIAVLLLIMVVISCKQGENYKTVRDEVMKFHDVVMEDHGKIVSNQMKLDTLLRSLKMLKQQFQEIDTLKEKTEINALLKRLTGSEDSMNDWMHKFEPDVTGKSNEEAVKYFKEEKIKIYKIDSLYKADIAVSDAYLTKFKKP
jgi:GTPase involved in cell partitioning and DNA repair